MGAGSGRDHLVNRVRAHHLGHCAIQSGNPAAIAASATGPAVTIIPLAALLVGLHHARTREWLIRIVVSTSASPNG
jgi:hypothetical protein